jgi:N-succinyldiaminopimelate aminotransferase
MNPDLAKLRPYPFQRWRALKATVTPPTDRRLISLGIGEPKHAQPEPVLEVLRTELDLVGRYPPTQGTLELREAIASWVTRRFGLSDGAVDPGRHVLPVNGTREALFSFVQAAIGRTEPGALVAMPNPYYQIYEGAALLAGAEPAFLPCSREGGYQPDLQSVPDSAWQRTKILFLCSPSNPTATVLPLETLQYALELADRFDFIVCADECYSEVYFDEQSPPPGLLDACRESGRTGFERAVVFHSLSKCRY